MNELNDHENILIRENIYYGESDSLFMSFDYINKLNNKEIHSNSTTYIENKYDDENRIIEQNQIFEETKKIRWKKEFVYSTNIQVNKFETFYGDGNENAKIEIVKYDNKKRIVTREIFREKSKTLLCYYYAENGIIKEITESESHNENYKLTYTTCFKIKRKNKYIDKLTVEKINSQLIDKTSI